MNIAEIMNTINQVQAQSANFNPDLALKALLKIGQNAIVNTLIQAGPSVGFVKKYTELGYSEEEANKLFEAVLLDAVGLYDPNSSEG